MQILLLALGLLFPAISLLTFIASTIQAGKTPPKHSSAVYIPFIGPILLDLWLLNNTGAPGWALAIPWVLDLGTVMFAIMIPGLFAEFWRTSRFTRILSLEGNRGGDHTNETVKLSFHKGGHYVLMKKWKLPPGEAGITGLGEPGTYVQRGDATFELTSHTDCVRRIEKREDGVYEVVADPTSPEDYQLEGWTLRVVT